MSGTVAIVAALDTKGTEANLLADIIRATGLKVCLIDTGVIGDPAVDVDVSADRIAAAAGKDLSEFRKTKDKATAMKAMAMGVEIVVEQLAAEGKIDGVIGLGGTAGTLIGCAAMKRLPVGVPKLMVSTVASGDTAPYVGTKDITMMYSVVDIAGLNRISMPILSNAAHAISGMVKGLASTDDRIADDRPLIAASMFGNTTECIERARAKLEASGYEVLVFHATGAGGQTMESLVSDGLIDGVLDLTTTELADNLADGVFNAGAERLTAAAKKGVPQVVAPGCLDMVNFWAPETVPTNYEERRFYNWNPNITLMRTTPSENAVLGKEIAAKLNASTAPTYVLFPAKGLSQLDSEGGEFWWPEANTALLEAIRDNLENHVELIVMDNNINDEKFADVAAELLMKSMEG